MSYYLLFFLLVFFKNGSTKIKIAMIPKEYSKRFERRWTPIPEIIARRGSKFISLNVKAQADAHVPSPAIPLIGRTEVSSPPVVPRIVFQKLKFLRVKP